MPALAISKSSTRINLATFWTLCETWWVEMGTTTSRHSMAVIAIAIWSGRWISLLKLWDKWVKTITRKITRVTNSSISQTWWTKCTILTIARIAAMVKDNRTETNSISIVICLPHQVEISQTTFHASWIWSKIPKINSVRTKVLVLNVGLSMTNLGSRCLHLDPPMTILNKTRIWTRINFSATATTSATQCTWVQV